MQGTLEEELAAARERLAQVEGAPLSESQKRERQELLALVERAFASTGREGGVGPRESRAIDDYAVADEQQRARAADVEQRWQELPDEVLFFADTGLSFADEAGRRFLLPAYVRLALRYIRNPFTVVDHAGYFLLRREPAELVSELRLDPEQLAVIARFLDFWSRLRPGCPEEEAQVARWTGLAGLS